MSHKKHRMYNDSEKKNHGSHVFSLNDEFTNEVPTYFLDSGVVITYANIEEWEMYGATDEDIIQLMVKGNPSNINEETARVLLERYRLNKEGKCAFCIPPAVYKETMYDGGGRFPKTRKFVTENCFVAFPNIPFEQFAELTAGLEKALRGAKSSDGYYGLNPEFKKNKKGKRYDANFEDRLILAQIAVIALLGRKNVRFVSCAQPNQAQNEQQSLDLYGKTQKLSEIKMPRPSREGYGPGSHEIFMQINGKDFGDRTKGNNGMRQVSFLIEEIVEKYLNGQAQVSVVTPDELGRREL